MPQFDFEGGFLRHISTDAISNCFEWKLCLSSFRGTGTHGTKLDKLLGQNFGVETSSRELCQDAILMMSSYRQKCLWPGLTTPCVCVLNLHSVLAYLHIHTQNIITIGANYHVLICHLPRYLNSEVTEG